MRELGLLSMENGKLWDLTNTWVDEGMSQSQTLLSAPQREHEGQRAQNETLEV